MKQRTIVVLGGAQSGPTAAARAREVDENARIVICERARDVSYRMAGLAYHLSGEVSALDDLNRETAEFFRDVYDIEVRTKTGASRIDAKNKRVEIGMEVMDYDALIYALGAESIMPAVVAGAGNVYRFRTLRDLEGIVAAIEAGKKRVAILGGGFFGLEAADGLLRRKCDVTVVEQEPRVVSNFSPSVSAVALDALRRLGARVLTGNRVVRAERQRDQITELELDSGERLPVDFVIAAVGLAPRTQLLGAEGAALLEDGSVKVDSRMRTSLTGIFACGVCAAVEHAISGVHGLVGQAAIADKTAQVAGANAAGAKLKMAPVLGTAIVRVGDRVCARTGISAAAGGKGVRTSFVHAPSHDGFFPGSSAISVELHYDEKTGRLLGADLSGAQGVDKRVDVLATAISAKLELGQLAELDLAYAPPFSAARDPVNVAATVALAAKDGAVRAVDPRELLAQPERFSLVDVRPESMREPPLEGALAIQLPTLRKRLGELPKKRTVVFVDDTGRAAYLAATIALQKGVKGAGYLSGGLRTLELLRGRA